jgi:hypothetical protein
MRQKCGDIPAGDRTQTRCTAPASAYNRLPSHMLTTLRLIVLDGSEPAALLLSSTERAGSNVNFFFSHWPKNNFYLPGHGVVFKCIGFMQGLEVAMILSVFSY